MTKQIPKVFGPAAGWIKTPKQVGDICREPNITHITIGSYTLEPRTGNTGGTQFSTRTDGASINSMGLPNEGLQVLCENQKLHEMIGIIDAAKKKSVVSVAAFDPGEYARVVLLAVQAIPDVIEINCGCPNVIGEGGRHPIVSLDLRALELVVSAVNRSLESISHPKPQVWYKLSPHVDQGFRIAAAKILAHHADGLVLCNTIPDGRWQTRSGRPVLGVANGYGGIAGSALLELSLINVEGYDRALRDLQARDRVILIGAGGISHGDHLARYRQAGADGGVIGTAFFSNDDPRIFGQILEQYVREG